jgi:ABC-type polysaccharide/polyol phosphate export permease
MGYNLNSLAGFFWSAISMAMFCLTVGAVWVYLRRDWFTGSHSLTIYLIVTTNGFGQSME